MTWADDLAGMADELGDLVTTEPVLLATQAATCHQLLADLMRAAAQETPDSDVFTDLVALLRERVRLYIDKQREVMASHERRRDHPEVRERKYTGWPGTFPESIQSLAQSKDLPGGRRTRGHHPLATNGAGR